MFTARPIRPVLVALAGLSLAACTTTRTAGSAVVHSPRGATASPTRTPSTDSSPTAPQRIVPVHVKINIWDGESVGVGMPLIATFDKKITDARAFAKATAVTVNGKPIDAQWFFEYSDVKSGHVMEAHLRPQLFWPANAQIQVQLRVRGLNAGAVPNQANAQYQFDDDLTANYATTDAHILTVSNATHTLTVEDNGKVWGTFPISLGASDTPTKSGIKVIMEKGVDVRMVGPGYDDPHVKYTQRLTYGGEYLHAAPWNCVGFPGCAGPANHIGSSNSSNGCTNLRPQDAITLYGFLGIGDVVRYPDADGPRMALGDGYGDWNVTWGLWQTGGVVPTH